MSLPEPLAPGTVPPGGAACERPAVTTPIVPELPQLPEFADRSPAEPRTVPPGRAFETAATGALLLLLALTVVLAVLAVPVGTLVPVALLLLVSVGVLAAGAREDNGPFPAQSPEDLADEAPETQGVYYYDRDGRPVPIDDAF